MEKFFGIIFCIPLLALAEPSPSAKDAAEYSAKTYSQKVPETLAALVSFPTVHEEGKLNRELPAVRNMSKTLKELSKKLGFDFRDDGDVVVMGFGTGKERLGLITHGDVQPADPTKWKKSPFEMDGTTEPDKWIGRGTEDDKGAIATALYAMKAIKDLKIPLRKRIELIVSYTEESDWDPFIDWVKKNPPPDLNIGIDAEYPVVVAEKGWCSFTPSIPIPQALTCENQCIREFRGGSFMSQVPEDARATIEKPKRDLVNALRHQSKKWPQVQFTFSEDSNRRLSIQAKGRSAHSSTPQDGLNAIAYLAALLAHVKSEPTPDATAVSLIASLFGTDYEGKKFGKVAYSHPFMGPLTANVSLVREKDQNIEVGVNLRRPLGKTKDQFEADMKDAFEGWKKKSKNRKSVTYSSYVGDPHYEKDAPHVPVLLDIFGFYTNTRNPQARSIGGGTHARLFPHGVNFGPGMPGEVYTGHSEHEFMKKDQLTLNLKMYTAMLVELAK